MFAVGEEAVSCMMGNDRLDDHAQAGAEIITGVDMSCLMHLDGLLRRQARPQRVMHLAEILATSQGPPWLMWLPSHPQCFLLVARLS